MFLRFWGLLGCLRCSRFSGGVVLKVFVWLHVFEVFKVCEVF